MGAKKIMSATEDKESRELGKAIVHSLAESMYLSGDLLAKDFEDKKVLKEKVLKYYDKMRRAKRQLSLVIDYQPSLLSIADKYIQEEEYDMAYVFYATFFEHLINGVIQVKCIKEKISNSTYKELIRKASLEDKFSWVLTLLKLPTFSNKHRKIVKTVSDKRNSFIHYKYQGSSDDPNFEENEWKKLKENLIPAISYSKAYQTRVTYDGKAKKLRLRKETKE